MDSIERVGVMLRAVFEKRWKDEKPRIRPEDIGAVELALPAAMGPNHVNVVLMAVDEHNDAKQEGARVDLARRHASYARRLEDGMRRQRDAPGDPEGRLPTYHKDMMKSLCAAVEDMERDPKLAESQRLLPAWEWFMDNAVWTEVP